MEMKEEEVQRKRRGKANAPVRARAGAKKRKQKAIENHRPLTGARRLPTSIWIRMIHLAFAGTAVIMDKVITIIPFMAVAKDATPKTPRVTLETRAHRPTVSSMPEETTAKVPSR